MNYNGAEALWARMRPMTSVFQWEVSHHSWVSDSALHLGICENWETSCSAERAEMADATALLEEPVLWRYSLGLAFSLQYCEQATKKMVGNTDCHRYSIVRLQPRDSTYLFKMTDNGRGRNCCVVHPIPLPACTHRFFLECCLKKRTLVLSCSKQGKCVSWLILKMMAFSGTALAQVKRHAGSLGWGLATDSTIPSLLA